MSNGGTGVQDFLKKGSEERVSFWTVWWTAEKLLALQQKEGSQRRLRMSKVFFSLILNCRKWGDVCLSLCDGRGTRTQACVGWRLWLSKTKDDCVHLQLSIADMVWCGDSRSRSFIFSARWVQLLQPDGEARGGMSTGGQLVVWLAAGGLARSRLFG